MAAAVVGAGTMSPAMEALSCTSLSWSVAPASKASLFVGNVGGKKLVALRSRNSAARVARRTLKGVKASGGNSTNTAAPVETPASGEAEIPIEKRYPAFPAVLDINQIMDILPHRFPFLLVDRVIEYNPGESVVAIKNVTINDNFFPGHFPQRPIMPGVLMLEAMAQAAGIMMLQPEVGGSKESFFFAGVDKVRFRKPVIAGDTLLMKMKLTKLNKRFGVAKMDGQAYVGGDLVCEGEFMMALEDGDKY
uniref:3-hydroxyacyl-[acyl-carrier-protein] dehydratase n=1 Tax=Physcomitrium patens TaxID=3218 RepID=A0A7I4F4N5_PHYPA